MRFWRLGLLCGAWVTCAAAASVPSSGAIAFDRPEAWALEYYASASLLTELGPPPVEWVHFGLEGDWLPALSRSQTLVGFDGTKVEALNRASAFGRPRVMAGLPLGLSLQLAWLPPIPLHGAQANLFSASVTRAFELADFTLSVTALGQVGSISGDFTCPGSVVNSPSQNAFSCEQASKDSARLDYAGLAATAAYRIRPAFDLTPYVSAHVTYMNLGFDVNAQYDGFTDRTRLTTQGATFAGAAGLAIPLGTRFRLSAELFYTPLFVKRPGESGDSVEGLFNARALISTRLF